MLALLAGTAIGEEAATQPVAADPAIAEPKRPLEPHDLVRISVLDVVGPGVTIDYVARLDPDGLVRLPLVGRQRLKGLTRADAAGRLKTAYHDVEMIRNAIVRIALLEPAARATMRSGPIQTGDTVEIHLWELWAPNTEDTLSLVVTEGQVGLPLVGKVKLAGMSEADAADHVQKVYLDRQIMRSLNVTVLRVKAPQ